MTRIIRIKKGVILHPNHFKKEIARLVTAVHIVFPPNVDLIITRGSESVPNGKLTSKHLMGCAYDFRTKHLPPNIDRHKLVRKIQQGMSGCDYYWYYGQRVGNDGKLIEWIHGQYNKYLKEVTS